MNEAGLEPTTILAEAGEPHNDGVRLLVCDERTGMMASADLGMNFALWRDGFPVAKLELANYDEADTYIDRILAAKFSPAGPRVFVACSSEVLAINTETCQLDWVYRPERVFGFWRSVPLAIEVLPSGKLLVASTVGNFNIIDENGKSEAEWRDSNAPQAMAILPDGDTLLGTDGHTMRTWSVQNRKSDEGVNGGEDIITLQMSPVGNYAIVRKDNNCQRFDIATNEFSSRIDLAPAIPALAIRGDGEEVALLEDGGVTKTDAHLRRTAQYRPGGTSDWTGAPTVGMADEDSPPPRPRVISTTFEPKTGNVLMGMDTGEILTWLR